MRGRRAGPWIVSTFGTLVVFGCALRLKGTSGDDRHAPDAKADDKRLTETQLNTRDDVVGYATFCKQELGLPPATLKPWNCLDGAEIPITVDGLPPTEAVYAELAAHRQGCDLPSWLGDEPCSNYAFVAQRSLSPDVDALLLCRMRRFTSPKDARARRADLEAAPTEANFRAYYQFDSLGLIWTHKVTGKTCYFDFVGASYGGFVPSPDDERVPTIEDLPAPRPTGELADGGGKEGFWRRNARGTWRAPHEVAARDQCARCHDSGPYKASPWISQVFDVPRNDPTVPYEIVGAAFAGWRERFPALSISTLPITAQSGASEPQVCTTCHRIGAHATCDSFVEYSTGKAAPTTLSERGRSFFHRTWMPPAPAAWQGKSEAELADLWTAANERHVARLKCCCLSPGAKGCTSQDFSRAPIPQPVVGTGPAICL